MCVSEGISGHSRCLVRNGNFLKMRVSDIRVKQICVNQGLGVRKLYFSYTIPRNHSNDLSCSMIRHLYAMRQKTNKLT